MNRYVSDASRVRLAREIAGESIVLLKNEGALPLRREKPAAFFGKGQFELYIGGSGSGASSNKNAAILVPELKKRGQKLVDSLTSFYEAGFDPGKAERARQEMFKQFSGLVASGAIYEFFGKYTPPEEETAVPDELVAAAAKETDTAVLILGRSSGGEECDRRYEQDYTLLPSEEKLIQQVTSAFAHVILIENTVGAVDLSWAEKYPNIEAILYAVSPGEQGAAALADILVGEISPSGKLTSTIVKDYKDHPASAHFSFNKDDPSSILTYESYGLDKEANGSVGYDMSPVSVYEEGIYAGYRYFDSYGVEPLYPFGFGLSYTSFELSDYAVSVEGENVKVSVKVANTGKYAGKEVVQVYVSAPAGKLDQPYQELKGYGKTSLLAPGEAEVITVTIPAESLASYDEETASYILEPGDYIVRAGVSSRDTHVAGKLHVSETIVAAQYENVLTILPDNKAKLHFLHGEDAKFISYPGEAEEIEKAAVTDLTADNVVRRVACHQEMPELHEVKGATLQDVIDHRVSVYDFVNQLSDDQLAAFCVGYGPGLPFGGGKGTPSTIQGADGKDLTVCDHPAGFPGYVSPAIPEMGIHSAFYKDGPATVGKVSWPTGSAVAMTFNPALAYAFGEAAGAESDSLQIDSWLAPAANIQRALLGGRNFEYFSEDPVVSGITGLQIVLGCEETSRATCCPKHYALNEQETYRRGKLNKNIDAVNSIVEERAAREIYLKPFEMIVRGSHVRTIMSSFNRINGIFAGGSYDLCRKLLRDEWGFRGVVVTDWGDMDIVVDGGDAVHAGNDIVMPGGPPVIAQIQKALAEGRVTRADMIEAVANLMRFVMEAAVSD